VPLAGGQRGEGGEGEAHEGGPGAAAAHVAGTILTRARLLAISGAIGGLFLALRRRGGPGAAPAW
jgi:hypothetical protein